MYLSLDNEYPLKPERKKRATAMVARIKHQRRK